MTYIEIKTSRIKYVLLLMITIGFVAGGIFILMNNGPAWVGWMSIIFFGSGIPLFIWQIADSRPRLIIDDEGVNDRTLGVGKILWKDIGGAYLKSIQNNDFICLQLKNTEKYLGKLSPIKQATASANAKLGFTPLSLNLSGVSANADQVLELVLKMSETSNG